MFCSRRTRQYMEVANHSRDTAYSRWECAPVSAVASVCPGAGLAPGHTDASPKSRHGFIYPSS